MLDGRPQNTRRARHSVFRRRRRVNNPYVVTAEATLARPSWEGLAPAPAVPAGAGTGDPLAHSGVDVDPPTGSRRDAIRRLFPAIPAQQRERLVDAVAATAVRDSTGAVRSLAERLASSPLTSSQAERVLGVTALLRHAWLSRGTDNAYDDVNWRHTCAEVAEVIEIGNAGDFVTDALEDAILASLFSDAAKLRGNFLVHHVDGAVAATALLPSFFADAATVERRAPAIAQIVLEHQVGPPRFMAAQVRQGIERALGKSAARVEAALDRLELAISHPLAPGARRMHEAGYGVLDLDAETHRLLAAHVCADWYVPHPETAWVASSMAVIDADSIVNYATPDGVAKIVAICGPGTAFTHETAFASIGSCGVSLLDAVTLMSSPAVEVARRSVAVTTKCIEAARRALRAELEGGALRFPREGFSALARAEEIAPGVLQVRALGEGCSVDVVRTSSGVPFWDAPLDYGDRRAVAFARLLRRRIVAELRRLPAERGA